MIRIFNIFDPINSNFLALNWIIIIIPILFLLNNYWIVFPRWNILWIKIFLFLDNELNVILKKKIFKLNFVSIFSIIILINFIGLFSFVFTRRSHIVINFRLSLPFWLRFIFLGWIYNCNHILAHQVPIGTPNILIPFIVLIELIRNLIRPGTLRIRLTANIIAGHLLLTLIRNNGNKLIIIFSIILIIVQTLLILLEIRVAFIQAYVFTILLSLYSQEI